MSHEFWWSIFASVTITFIGGIILIWYTQELMNWKKDKTQSWKAWRDEYAKETRRRALSVFAGQNELTEFLVWLTLKLVCGFGFVLLASALFILALLIELPRMPPYHSPPPEPIVILAAGIAGAVSGGAALAIFASILFDVVRLKAGLKAIKSESDPDVTLDTK